MAKITLACGIHSLFYLTGNAALTDNIWQNQNLHIFPNYCTHVSQVPFIIVVEDEVDVVTDLAEILHVLYSQQKTQHNLSV